MFLIFWTQIRKQTFYLGAQLEKASAPTIHRPVGLPEVQRKGARGPFPTTPARRPTSLFRMRSLNILGLQRIGS